MPETISVTFNPTHVSVKPDGQATAEVVIKNRSEEVGHYALQIVEDSPGWVEIQPNQLSAFPYQEVRAQAIIHPPANTQGAIYHIMLCVSSQERQDVEGRSQLDVEVSAPAATVTRQTEPQPAPVRQPLPVRPPADAKIELRLEPVANPSLPPPAVQWNLRLRNAGNILDTFGFSFNGIDQSWVTIDPVEVSLNPGDPGTALLTVRPAAGAKAGVYRFTVRAFSHVNFNERTEVTLSVEVKASAGFTLDISPREAETQGPRDFLITLNSTPTANSDLWLDFNASDPEIACDYRIQPPRVLLPARQRASCTLRVTPRGILGPNERKQYAVKIEAFSRQGEVPPQTVDVRLTQVGAAPVSLSLQPQVQTAEMEADYILRITNPSMVDSELFLSAEDPEQACSYFFSPDRRVIQPRGSASARMHVSAHAPNKNSAERQIGFTVAATRRGDVLPISSVQGTFKQQAARPLEFELIPPQQSGAGMVRYVLRVVNPSRQPMRVLLEARDQEDAVRFQLVPVELLLAPGGEGVAAISAVPKDKLTEASPRRVHNFQVYAKIPGNSTPATVPGILAQIYEAPFGLPPGTLRFLVSLIKFFFRFLKWVVMWAIIILVLVFIADLGLAGLFNLMQDPQIGQILNGVIPMQTVISLHQTMLFRSISDNIVKAIIQILQVVQTKMMPSQ